MSKASCAYHPVPDLWHYENSIYQDERELTYWNVAEAKRICRDCPVKSECLAEGLKDENVMVINLLEGSVWGGLTTGERLNIRDGRETWTYRKERLLIASVNQKIAILDQ